MIGSLSMTYAKRAETARNPSARELFTIMEEKKSNLAVALDVTTKQKFLDCAKRIAPHICLLKTHIDIIEDFDNDLLLQLQELAEEERFLILEDRKFADIGNTVLHQYEGGIYNIARWAHLATVHSVPGPGVIEGLRKIGLDIGRGILLLAEMSSSGSLAKGSYTEETLEMARRYSDFVIGFIAQRKLTDEPFFIHMTPGVSFADSGDSLGQQYNSPEYVIAEKGSDLIIVGRGIIHAEDPAAAAKQYQEAGWRAYERRIKNGNLKHGK